jgi:arginase
MSFDELTALIKLLVSSDLAVGMDITIFDPELDPEGKIARLFTQAIIQGFK